MTFLLMACICSVGKRQINFHYYKKENLLGPFEKKLSRGGTDENDNKNCNECHSNMKIISRGGKASADIEFNAASAMLFLFIQNVNRIFTCDRFEKSN